MEQTPSTAPDPRAVAPNYPLGPRTTNSFSRRFSSGRGSTAITPVWRHLFNTALISSLSALFFRSFFSRSARRHPIHIVARMSHRYFPVSASERMNSMSSGLASSTGSETSKR